MPAYDSTQFDPPAPLALVTLRNPASGGVLPDVPMLLDSGADVSLIPQQAASTLEALIEADTHYELVGFSGTPRVAAAVRLEMIFCRRTFRGRFLLVDQTWGILGRNVLNAVPLLLDGPRLSWEEPLVR